MLPVLLLWLLAPSEPGACGEVRAREEESIRTRAIAVLRESRAKDGPSHAAVVEQLARSGPDVIDPLLDLLRDRRIPALAADQRVQTLSVPQREMILDALSRWSARAILANVDARVAVDASEQNRVAALYVYSSHGSSRHFARLLELAGATPAQAHPEEELSAEEADALRSATARILGRDASGFTALAKPLQQASAAELRPLLFALGDTGDSCAVPLLAPALTRHPELAAIVLSQARRVGSCFDAEANRRLAQAARPYLAAEREDLASAAARTLGELGDGASAQELIAALGSVSPQLAESAHWALRRMSRLDFGPRTEAWNAWLASEREWWESDSARRIDELVRGSRATRLAAVASVGARTWRRHEAAEAVLSVLSDNDPLLRESAAHALGQLASPVAIPRLVEALTDPEPSVSAAARGALVAIVGTHLPEAPDECRKVLHLAP